MDFLMYPEIWWSPPNYNKLSKSREEWLQSLRQQSGTETYPRRDKTRHHSTPHICHKLFIHIQQSHLLQWWACWVSTWWNKLLVILLCNSYPIQNHNLNLCLNYRINTNKLFANLANGSWRKILSCHDYLTPLSNMWINKLVKSILIKRSSLVIMRKE